MMETESSGPSYGNGPLTTEGIEDNALTPEARMSGTEPPPAEPEPRAIRTLKTVGWVFFGLFCLILFTILKLPDDRIKAYVQGAIASALAPKGITFTAEKGYVSVGWGISYVMKDVKLNFPPPDGSTAHIDRITVTPSILPMIFGYQGGSLTLYDGDGKLSGSFSMKGTNMSASFAAKQLDLGKTGLLALAAGIKGTAQVTGSASFSGDMSIPSTLTGDVDLSLNKIVLDPQAISILSVPRISISEGKIELTADKGKATIKTLRLGKPGSSDDLIGTASGDIILGRNWDSSTLNAKANLKLSDTLSKAFFFVEGFLGPGKQGDGSYSLTLSGPVTMPNPTPMAPGSK